MSKPNDLHTELLDLPLRQLLDFAHRGRTAQAKLDTLISAIHQAEADTEAPARACPPPLRSAKRGRKAVRTVKAKPGRGVKGKTHPNGMPLERDGVKLNAAGKPRPVCQVVGCGAQDGTVWWKVCASCRAAGKRPGNGRAAPKAAKRAPIAKAAPPAADEKPLGGAWAAQFRMRLKQEPGLEGKPGVAAVIAMIAAGRTPTRSELPEALR